VGGDQLGCHVHLQAARHPQRCSELSRHVPDAAVSGRYALFTCRKWSRDGRIGRRGRERVADRGAARRIATTRRGPRARPLCTSEASGRSVGPRVALDRRAATGGRQKGWREVVVSPTSGGPRGGKTNHYNPPRSTRSTTMYLGSLRPLGGSAGRLGPTWGHWRSSERVVRGGVGGWVVVGWPFAVVSIPGDPGPVGGWSVLSRR
jgi:hypothetical protein